VPYHFTINADTHYLDTHSKERVACQDELFPSKVTIRKFKSKSNPEIYLLHDYFRIDSFMQDKEGNIPTSTFSLSKTSLFKLIVSKAFHAFEYEFDLYKVEDTFTSDNQGAKELLSKYFGFG
jgi:hypothetical protein